jgi:hypothetical protein
MRLLSNLFALAAVVSATATAWIIWPPLVGVLVTLLLARLALLTDGAVQPTEESA